MENNRDKIISIRLCAEDVARSANLAYWIEDNDYHLRQLQNRLDELMLLIQPKEKQHETN